MSKPIPTAKRDWKARAAEYRANWIREEAARIKLESDISSLQLELKALEHCRLKDNEYLIAERDEARRERDEAKALKLSEVMGAAKRVCDERDRLRKALEGALPWMRARPINVSTPEGYAEMKACEAAKAVAEVALKGE